MDIIKVSTIKPGLRVIIRNTGDFFRVMVQEHKSICSPYTDSREFSDNGWRTSQYTGRSTVNEAEEEFDRMVEQQIRFNPT